MGQSQLEQMLQKAQEQARLHSTGSFSLDVASASRQFGQYALSEPIAIVARLIRIGALCNGTVQVDLAARSTRVIIGAHWAAVSSLAQAFDQVLAPDPADREFSIALNSIVNRPFEDLQILRGEPGRIGQLLMTSERQAEVAEAVNLAQDSYFTQIQWKTPQSRSLARDLETLRNGFRYCRAPLTLNGQRLAIPMGHPRGPGMLRHLGAARQVLLKGAWYRPASYFWADHQALEFRLYSNEPERNEVALPEPGLASSRFWSASRLPEKWSPCYLALSFASDLSSSSRVDWVHRGQLVESEAANFALPAVTAVVSCHGLSMDLLGEKPVHNQAFSARQSFLADWLNCLEEELSPRYPKAGRSLMLKVLFDTRLHKGPIQLPRRPKVEELLRRLNPIHQGV